MEFDPYSEEFFSGTWDTYRWLRDEAPVYRNDRLGFWALSRWEDVNAGSRDWATYSSAHGTMLDQLNTPDFSCEAMPGWLLVYDPPAHTRLRRLAAQAFTPRAVGDLQDAVRRAVERSSARLDDTGSFDLVEDFGKQIPADVMYDLMGVPEADRKRALELSDNFLYAGDEGEADGFNEVRIQAMTELMGYLMGLVQEKRLAPTDDIMSRMLVTSYVDEHGVEQRLTDTEMSFYLLLLLAAGVETTTKLLAAAVVALHRNPGEWEKILHDPRRIPAAVEEAGRYEAPVQFLGRRATRDVTLHGTTIPAGSNVLLLMGAANRDERAYPEPDRFDIDRSFEPPPITYGWGPHLCLGIHLARLEVQVALEEIRNRWAGFEVDEDGLERVRGFHVFGWSKVPLSVTTTSRVAGGAHA